MKVEAAVLAVLIFSCAALSYDMYEQYRLPAGWRAVRPGRVSDVVPFYIAAKQQNLDKLEAIVLAVSNPKASTYGDYLTRNEVDRLVAPTAQTQQQIERWLEINQLRYEHPVPDWYVVRCAATKAAELFQVEFHQFEHQASGIRVVKAAGDLKIPEELKPHIDFIGGLTDFPSPDTLIEHPPLEVNQHRNHFDSVEPVILYMLPGDSTLATFFLPVCLNGLTTLDASQPCSDQGSAIGTVIQTVKQLGHGQVYENSAEEMLCKPCTSWTSRQLSNCESANTEYGLPNNTVYCNSPLLVGFTNYYQTNFSIQVQFQNGQFSDTADWTIRPMYLGRFVTPAVLLDRYGVPPGREVCLAANNSQSVAEFTGQFYAPSDLNYFFQAMGVVPAEVVVVGQDAPSFPGSEATLDIEFIMGVAQNVTTYFWDEGLTFLGWIVDVLNSPNPPLVHSVSYGGIESDYSANFKTRCDTEFQKAASMGLSLLFASGDSGVNSPDSTVSCTETGKFLALFPASSPYVTAVGATQFSTQISQVCSDTVIGLPVTCDDEGEIGCSISTGSRITSGGGFSEFFPRPSYQDAVVNYYLASNAAGIPSQYYNSSGRAYPDIAACGRNFLVYISGAWDPVDGTSAAAPTAAALLTLANDYRIQNGLPVVGFVNPALYQDVFSGGVYSQDYFDRYWDITMGNNNCGTQGQPCCPYGWTTARGWDAMTGLGTFSDVTLNQVLFPPV